MTLISEPKRFCLVLLTARCMWKNLKISFLSTWLSEPHLVQSLSCTFVKWDVNAAILTAWFIHERAKRERGMQMSRSGFALGPGAATNKPISLKELTALLHYLTVWAAHDSYRRLLCECWCHHTELCVARLTCAVQGECQNSLLVSVVYCTFCKVSTGL